MQSNLALRLLLRLVGGLPWPCLSTGSQCAAWFPLTCSARAPLHSPHFPRYVNQGAYIGPTVMNQLTKKGMLLRPAHTRLVSKSLSSIHIWLPTTWRIGGTTARTARDQENQLRQLATVVPSQPQEAIVLVAGDFNIPRGSWLYSAFLEQSGMVDPLAGDMRPTYRPFPTCPCVMPCPLILSLYGRHRAWLCKQKPLSALANNVAMLVVDKVICPIIWACWCG